MQSFIRRLVADSFFQYNAIFFFGSFVAAILNYLFHPILGRLLSREAFGEVEAILSLSMQAGVIVTVFTILVTHLVANHEPSALENAVVQKLQRLALVLVAILCVVLVAISTRLQTSFRFGSLFPFFALAMLLFVGVMVSFRNARLQGLHRFRELSLAGILGSGSKLVLAVTFVLFGWGTNGAVAALVFANVAVWWYVQKQVRHHLKVTPEMPIAPDELRRRMRQELVFGAFIFLVLSTVTFLSTGDIVVVKLLFSPEIAGNYSGIATVARIIFFLTGSISGVLLPMVKRQNDTNTNRRLLIKAFLLTMVLGGAVLVVFAAWPQFAIRLFIGTKYDHLAYLLPLVSLLLYLVSLLNVLIIYAIANRDYRVIPSVFLGVATVGLSLVWFHQTPTQVIVSFLCGVLVMGGSWCLRMGFIYLRHLQLYGRT